MGLQVMQYILDKIYASTKRFLLLSLSLLPFVHCIISCRSRYGAPGSSWARTFLDNNQQSPGRLQQTAQHTTSRQAALAVAGPLVSRGLNLTGLPPTSSSVLCNLNSNIYPAIRDHKPPNRALPPASGSCTFKLEKLMLFSFLLFSLSLLRRAIVNQRRARCCSWRCTSAAWQRSPGGPVWRWPGSWRPVSSGATKPSRAVRTCSIWWRGLSRRCRPYSC